jgi:hypothetical protein
MTNNENNLTSIYALNMGDRFRFPGDPHVTYGPVSSVESSVGLHWTDVRFGKNDPVVHRASFTRVEITQAGPRCECGKAYDLCDMDCQWPDEVEAIWRNSF